MSFQSKQVYAALITYLIILSGYFIASIFPSLRIWGVDWWAYYPTWVALMLFGIGLMLAVGLFWLLRRKVGWLTISDEETAPSGKYFWTSLAVLIISGLMFHLLRVRTHFLGEGYNLLTQFEKGVHLVKFTGWGESLMHIELKKLLGGDNIADSIASFRIISIVSGLGWTAFVLYSARRLFDSKAGRNLFVLGLMTGGYMLLFFGYVEYYSCFVAAVGIFSLSGVMIARQKINRWFILPPLVLAIFCHVFGWLLVPGTLYLLLLNSGLSRWWQRVRLSVRWGIILTVAIVLIVAFYNYYANDLFFQLSLVPLMANQFTLAGYTLFSPAHLADIANLLLVLVPSLPLFIILLFYVPLRKTFSQPVYVFLIILNICALAAVFLLDPNYGMPRDWDFFAFAGIVLAVLCFYFLLDKGRSLAGWPVVAVLTISLGLLVLVPRVISQSVPEVIIPHFKTYLKQNCQIDREGRLFLVEYYHRTGNAIEEIEEKAIWYEKDLYGRAVAIGKDLIEMKKYTEAAVSFRKAIDINPVCSIAYDELGKCFFYLKQYDSSLFYLEIASAINPYNAAIYTKMGIVYFSQEDYDKAEKCWLKAIKVNDIIISSHLYLLKLYELIDNRAEYNSHLKIAGRHKDAPMDIVRRLAEYYLEQGEFDSAAVFYREALVRGLDSSYIIELQKEYPSLKVF